jgi:hypothetical protein
MILKGPEVVVLVELHPRYLTLPALVPRHRIAAPVLAPNLYLWLPLFPYRLLQQFLAARANSEVPLEHPRTVEINPTIPLKTVEPELLITSLKNNIETDSTLSSNHYSVRFPSKFDTAMVVARMEAEMETETTSPIKPTTLTDVLVKVRCLRWLASTLKHWNAKGVNSKWKILNFMGVYDDSKDRIPKAQSPR